MALKALCSLYVGCVCGRETAREKERVCVCVCVCCYMNIYTPTAMCVSALLYEHIHTYHIDHGAKGTLFFVGAMHVWERE